MLEWLQSNLDPFDLFMLAAIIVYRKGIYVAIAGGNGRLQMTELAQSLLLVVFYISVRAERLRSHEYAIFPEAYWVMLFTAITVIAGIKEKVFHKLLHKEKTDEKSPG
jgi:hypothetical protein